MFKIIFAAICFSLVLLAWLNLQISTNVLDNVIQANPTNSDFGQPLFYSDVNHQIIQADQERFRSYLHLAYLFLAIASILFISSIALLIYKPNLNFNQNVKAFPLLILFYSWLIISLVYYLFSYWDDKYFFTIMNSQSFVFSGYRYDSLRVYFNFAWYFKLFLVLFASIVQLMNNKRGVKYLKNLFIVLVILDLTFGNIVISVWHDDIDQFDKIFGLYLRPE